MTPSDVEIPDHIKKTLEEFKTDAANQVADLKRAIESINMIERRYRLPLTSLTELEAFGVPALSELQPSLLPGPQRTGTTDVRFDLYLGLPPLEAAKRYIEPFGHAVHFDEICDAVRRGGAATKGSDWKDKLHESLVRSTAEVVKVQDNVFGLVKFYSEEQLRGLRSTRRQAAPPSKAKRKPGRPPGSKNKKKTQVATTATAAPVAIKTAAASDVAVPLEGANGASAP